MPRSKCRCWRLVLLATTGDRASQIETERKALVQADADFQAARAERGLEGWLLFFPEDAPDFPPGSAMTFTKSATRERAERDLDPRRVPSGRIRLKSLHRCADRGISMLAAKSIDISAACCKN